MKTKQLFEGFFSAGAKTFFSNRSVDFTLPEGNIGLTAEQKEYLSTQTKVQPDNIINIRQVHGSEILTVFKKFENIPEADGLITNTPGLALAVRTADCIPIFIYDPQKKCIGLVHAGWRGSRKRIVTHVVNRLSGMFGCDPEDLLIAFGPGIRECCYEIRGEAKKSFVLESEIREGKFYLDLVLVNRDQLIQAGVRFKNIFDCGRCTCCDDQFFSYRREGDKTGRHLSLIMI